jgi:iron-sulfur cluster repair protein YtfE (RIC family)
MAHAPRKPLSDEERHARTGLWVAAAAAVVGLIGGIAVSAGRRAAAEAVEAMTGDWIDALKAEHLLLVEMFDDLEATHQSDVGKRRRLAQRLRAAIDKHLFQVESVIYPAYAAVDPDAARKAFAEQAEIKILLYGLDDAAPDSLGFLHAVHRLRRRAEDHMRREEDELFPRLQRALAAGQAAQLTAQMHRAGVKLA